MFKGNNKYYLILLLLFAALIWVEYSQPKPVDWRRTYTNDDKIPFGCNAFYRLLKNDLFEGKVIQQDRSPFTVLSNPHEENIAYILISDRLDLPEADSKSLLDFVSKGNMVFMAAENFSGLLADTFKIETTPSYNLFNDTNKKVAFNFCNPLLKATKNYSYANNINVSYFTGFDTSCVSVLALADSNAIFVKAVLGKGAFYFMSMPDIYTNYFIVNNPNREAAYKSVNYLTGNLIYWDEFYKNNNRPRGSALQFIFANDSLYAGYSLAFLALLVFMIFALKRKQKAIPIVEPAQNTTLQFIEVIGSVYYNSKNHKIIAEEKIAAFLNFLRTRFSVTGKNFTEETLLKISNMSAISIEEIKHLFSVIHKLNVQTSITEKELIELNTWIENFYKQNKR